MKIILAIGAVGLLYLAMPSKAAIACEGCVMASETMPTQVACLISPDGPGEICTAGGGYCNEEGKCKKVQITGDGSLPTLESRGQFAASEGDAKTVTRRVCDEGIVARAYASGIAERMREETRSLAI